VAHQDRLWSTHLAHARQRIGHLVGSEGLSLSLKLRRGRAGTRIAPLGPIASGEGVWGNHEIACVAKDSAPIPQAGSDTRAAVKQDHDRGVRDSPWDPPLGTGPGIGGCAWLVGRRETSTARQSDEGEADQRAAQERPTRARSASASGCTVRLCESRAPSRD
jgi:hypothetical protein